MSEEPEQSNVVGLFDKKISASNDEKAPAEKPAQLVDLAGVDQNSVRTLNSVIEAVLKRKVSGVCVMATGENGLGSFWLSFPVGKQAQVEATRYLGLLELFKSIVIEVVANGVQGEDE